MKYLFEAVTFSEVPDEVTLCISISGCTIHCQGCHSRELWEDKGTPLTLEKLKELLDAHEGVTCLCILGGEADIDSLTELFQYAYQRVRTAWYCGLDLIPKDKLGIMQYLDYCKLGHYDQELGGLASPTTNQRFYKVDHHGNEGSLVDKTYLFNNKEKTNED